MRVSGSLRRQFFGQTATMLAGLSSVFGRPQTAPDAGSREIPKPDLSQSQLFLDDTWIEQTCRLERVWQPAQLFPEPVLKPEAPWEGRQLVMYGSVFRTRDEWRMYYLTYNPPEPSYFCLALSTDGLHWERPKLGSVDYAGNKNNNIVWAPAKGERHDGQTAYYDPNDTPYPYKLMYFVYGGERPRGEYVAFSKDGVSWKEHPEAVLTNTGDRTNVLPSRDHRGKYVAYLRHADMMKIYRARTIWVSESDDFIHWSSPEVILKPDLLEDPNTELYGMSAFRYSDIYLGMLERWYDNPDVIEVQLAWSRDGRKWNRPEKRSAFIGPAFPWNKGWNTCANTAPIQIGNQLWFYYGGRSSAHGQEAPHSYGAIGLASVGVDRFAAIRADFKEGELVTKPMVWPGGELVVNSTTTRYPEAHPSSGGGSLMIEVRSDSNEPVPGFSGDTKANHPGNSKATQVKWAEGRLLNELTGRRIRLVFLLQDARLHSFRAGQAAATT